MIGIQITPDKLKGIRIEKKLFLIPIFFLIYINPYVSIEGVRAYLVFFYSLFVIFLYSNIVLSRSLLKIYALFIVPVILSILFNVSNLSFFLTGSVQYVVGVLIFLIMLELAKRGESIITSNSLRNIFYIFFFGALLEIIGILRPFTHMFLEAFHGGGHLTITRDIAYLGYIRPVFWTSEPSDFSKGILVFFVAYYFMDHKKANLILVINLILLVLIGSPILLVSILLILFFRFKLHLLKIQELIRFLVIVVFGSLATGWIFKDSIRSFFLKRAENLLDDNVQTSEFVRVIMPFINVKDVISVKPFFGLGFGGKELIVNYTSLGRMEVFLLGGQIIGNNAIGTLIVYCGVVGAVVFFFALLYLARRYFGSILSFLAIFVSISFCMGAIESVRFWGYLGILGYCFYVNRENFIN